MFIQYYTYLYNQGDWTTSIILDLSPLHLYPFPSPHLKVPMSHNFLCEARGMHSESWVTNCAMNLLGTPPSFQSVPKTKPAWLKLSAARKEGVLLQPGTLAHTYPSSLELETGGQSPANYPYCRRRFTSQRVWVPGEPCASFFWPKNMLVVQENSDAQLPDRASYSSGTEGVVAHLNTFHLEHFRHFGN